MAAGKWRIERTELEKRRIRKKKQLNKRTPATMECTFVDSASKEEKKKKKKSRQLLNHSARRRWDESAGSAAAVTPRWTSYLMAAKAARPYWADKIMVARKQRDRRRQKKKRIAFQRPIGTPVRSPRRAIPFSFSFSFLIFVFRPQEDTSTHPRLTYWQPQFIRTRTDFHGNISVSVRLVQVPPVGFTRLINWTSEGEFFRVHVHFVIIQRKVYLFFNEKAPIWFSWSVSYGGNSYRSNLSICVLSWYHFLNG